ncbi:hypothetical protein MRB53_040951 [Persea americana]|nr:hypothetical protein MRB53_040951 [Persea americana]
MAPRTTRARARARRRTQPAASSPAGQATQAAPVQHASLSQQHPRTQPLAGPSLQEQAAHQSQLNEQSRQDLQQSSEPPRSQAQASVDAQPHSRPQSTFIDPSLLQPTARQPTAQQPTAQQSTYVSPQHQIPTSPLPTDITPRTFAPSTQTQTRTTQPPDLWSSPPPPSSPPLQPSTTARHPSPRPRSRPQPPPSTFPNIADFPPLPSQVRVPETDLWGPRLRVRPEQGRGQGRGIGASPSSSSPAAEMERAAMMERLEGWRGSGGWGVGGGGIGFAPLRAPPRAAPGSVPREGQRGMEGQEGRRRSSAVADVEDEDDDEDETGGKAEKRRGVTLTGRESRVSGRSSKQSKGVGEKATCLMCLVEAGKQEGNAFQLSRLFCIALASSTALG